MLLVAAAVVVGLVVGLALGGHPRQLVAARLRAMPLLAGGAVCELIGSRWGGGWSATTPGNYGGWPSAELVGGDVIGIAVHIGARVASHAAAAEVLVSSTVRDLLAGGDIRFADRGSYVLKGVAGEWRLYAAQEPE